MNLPGVRDGDPATGYPPVSTSACISRVDILSGVVTIPRCDPHTIPDIASARIIRSRIARSG